MSNVFELAADVIPEHNNAVIKVVGVGGGGTNAVQHMVNSQLPGVDFICANTDSQALQKMTAPVRLQLGKTVTKGLGAGANAEIGRQAAIEDRDTIRAVLEGADMVFITAGMGGGTGTGGAPVVAEIAREMGILTVGVVTKPFRFEGNKRMEAAESGIKALAEKVDSLIIIPNNRLLEVLGKVTLVEAFAAANNVLLGAVRGIVDVILRHGLINVDFADVRTVMSERGMALMGTGTAVGEDRARMATELAISSPLLDNVCLQGARGVLVSIAANSDLGIDEYHTVGSIVSDLAHEDAVVKIGTILDSSMGDEILVTVVATGLSETAAKGAQAHISQPTLVPPMMAAAVASGMRQGAAVPDYTHFDAPAIGRRPAGGVRNATAAQPKRNKEVNYMEIPAFLRRQAD